MKPVIAAILKQSFPLLSLLAIETRHTIPMSETFLTAEAEDISESTNFSTMALFGFFLALAGIFSIQYIQMMPIAIVGATLGAAALLLSKRFKLGFVSKTMGFLALAIGATTTSYGLSYRSIETNYDLEQAKKIAETYLDNLSKDNLDRVFFLVGFPADADEGPLSTDSATKRAMNRLREDFAHVEIRGRKGNPKWVFVGIESEQAVATGHTYKLLYRDEGQSIPPSYSLFVRKNCRKYDRTKPTVNWFVDKLEAAKKP